MKAWIFLFFLLPSKLLAQVELDLTQCREMALRNSKEIAIANRQQERASYDARAYRADYLPKLSVVGLGLYNQKKYRYKIKGGYLPTYKPGANGQMEPNIVVDPETHQPVTGADGTPVFQEYAFLPDIRLSLNLRGVYAAGVQLEQPIYMGGRVRTANEMARVGESIAGENIRLSRSEIIVETDEAYWQLLGVQEQVRAAMKYAETVVSLLENVSNARKVGMATENEVLKVQVRYNEALLMLQKARNGQMLAEMNLNRLIGLPLQTDIHLPDTLTSTVSPEIWTLDTSVAQRPDYVILQQEADVKERQVNVVRADFLPQIGISAGYGYAGGVKLNGQDEASATFTAMAAVKIPIFNWGEGRNKIRSARLEHETSRLTLDRSADLMRLEIASARFNIQDAETRIKMAGTALKQARENLTVSDNQYRVGMETLSDLLEAQAQWQQAWSQWIEAKANLHLNESRYLKAIGKLSDWATSPEMKE